MKPDRGYEALRRHRLSIPEATYFLTLCTQDRVPGLNSRAVAAALRAEILDIERAGYWTIRGAVIMPDHLHLLLTLRDRLPLGRAIARLKSKSKPALFVAGLKWQGNYYEHRLRDGDSRESVLLYLFLNPHRAGLVSLSENYSLFWLGDEENAWFKTQLDDGKPFPDWLC